MFGPIVVALLPRSELPSDSKHLFAVVSGQPREDGEQLVFRVHGGEGAA